MKTFIEDYLQNPSQAIAEAQKLASAATWADNIDDEMVYAQIASPEFALYQEMTVL